MACWETHSAYSYVKTFDPLLPLGEMFVFDSCLATAYRHLQMQMVLDSISSTHPV